jgi:hypothetical protein
MLVSPRTGQPQDLQGQDEQDCNRGQDRNVAQLVHGLSHGHNWRLVAGAREMNGQSP